MKSRKRLHSILSLLLAGMFLLSACQKSDPAPKEDTAPKQQEEEQQEEETPLEPVESFDPASYTNAMMLEDYDFFWTTLEENCAPLGAIREAAGGALDQWKAEYRQKVAALQDGDAEGFFNTMGEISLRFSGAAHIQVVKPSLYSRYMGGGSEWESDTQKQLLQSDKVRAFYQWAETLSQYQQGGQSSSAAQEETQEAIDQQISEKLNLYRQGDTAVAMVRGFDFYGEESNNTAVKMLQDFCLENLDAQDFIIDLSRNSGGNAYIWTEGFAPLFVGKTLTCPMVAAYKNGSVNVQMWDGWPENNPEVELQELSSLSTEDYPKLNMASLEGCDGVAVSTATIDYTEEENPNGEEFEGRLWILTDGENMSSAEMMVQYLKGEDFCTLVGKQTGGVSGIMTNPANMYAPMPNCGMLVRFSPFYFLNEDGTCNDLEGTHPDIETESGETAMQRCLKEIKKLQK